MREKAIPRGATRRMNALRISEARLNDMCYMLLKYNLGANPRECDIRVCMDMAVPEQRLVGRDPLMAMVLRPDEKSGRSHDVYYDVDPRRVYDETMTYLRDHWRLARGRWCTKLEWITKIVPALMRTPEMQCGVAEDEQS